MSAALLATAIIPSVATSAAAAGVIILVLVLMMVLVMVLILISILVSTVLRGHELMLVWCWRRDHGIVVLLRSIWSARRSLLRPVEALLRRMVHLPAVGARVE